MQDILASLQASFRAIYGDDIQVDPDDQDGQWLGIIAQAIHDSNDAAIAVYNQFSPATAQGVGLSSVVKINGIRRLVPSNSTAPLTVVGVAGTQLINARAADDLGLGTEWVMPGTVTVPVGGEITATGTCTTPGAVAVPENHITRIITPTAGWQTVNNAVDATPGSPTESDATLRGRQTSSTALPSITVLDGIIGALLNLGGVTEVAAIDNDTGTTDVNGIPAHSVAIVVAGGDVQEIVDVIGLKKTSGTQTYGSTSGTYTDAYDIPHTINFSIPNQKTISVGVTLVPLNGYSSAIGDEIKEAIAAYVSARGIGEDVLITRLYAPALLQGIYATPANPADVGTFELTSVKAAISPGTPGTIDLAIAFDEVAVCGTGDVTVTVL